MRFSKGMQKFCVTAMLTLAMVASTVAFPNETNTQTVAEAASTLSSGQWYRLTLGGGEMDTYTFKVPDCSYFYVRVMCDYYTYKGEVQDSSSWWMPVTISSNYKEYQKTNVHYSSGVWDSDYLQFKEGTKVQIKFSSSSSSDYEWHYRVKIVTKSKKDFEKENNDTRNKANSIKQNTTYTGLVRTGDDEDWYVFKAPSAGTYKVCAVNTSDSSAWAKAYLYDGSYTELNSLSVNSGEGWLSLGSRKLKKGEKLYIKMKGSYSYNFFYKIKVKKK